jgi:hypothetical protein
MMTGIAFAESKMPDEVKKAEEARKERERMEKVVTDSFVLISDNLAGAKAKFDTSYLKWGKSGIKNNCVRLTESQALRMSIIGDKIETIGTDDIRVIKKWLMASCLKMSDVAAKGPEYMLAVATFQGMNIDNVKNNTLDEKIAFEGLVRANSFLMSNKAYVSLPFIALGYYTRFDNEVFLSTINYIYNASEEELVNDMDVIIPALKKVEAFYTQ